MTASSSAAGGPVAELGTLLDQLTGALPAAPTPATVPEESASASPEVKPAFADLGSWVREYFVQVVERRVATGNAVGVFWCARWWAHPEAISRLYALWRAWETLRVSDPQTGMSIWWRDHLDPHLNALTSEYGPFNRCRADRHTDPAPLPTEPVPQEVLDQLPDAAVS